jgi:radical SAM protein with 4Fe4S-binding SPASM domain
MLRPYRKSGGVIGMPAHVQVEITNACNLRCQSCHRDLLYPETTTMTFEQFKKIYDEIRPVKINVSGLGEPFLNPDVFKIIGYAKAGGSAVNCATNLTLVGDKIDRIIESGINQLKVSIDAATAQTFLKIRKFDLYETLVGNIRKINARKKELLVNHPDIRFNFALQKDNIDELIPVVELARDLDIRAMFIQYLAYVDREDRKEKLVGDLTQEKIKSVITEADALTKKYGIATNIDMWITEFDYFWQNMQPGQYFSPDNRPCYFPWFSSWVDATGDVRPCPVIPWRRGVAIMGNVYTDSFRSIWNNETYRNFRRVHVCGSRPTDVCKTCLPVSLSSIFKIGTKLLPR